MNFKELSQAIVQGLMPYLVGNRNETKQLGETLKELLVEIKKKEQYAYEVQIDDNLRQELKGDKGDAPVFGKDFFSPAEVQEMIDKIISIVTPEIGRDYYTEEEKQALIDEISSKIEVENGDDGKTPEKGVDYFTEEDIAVISDDIISKVTEELKKNGKIKGKDIIDALRKLPKETALQIKDIYGLQNILEALDRKAGQRVASGSKGGGGIGETFETVSNNLKSYNYVLNYTGNKITSIVYDLGSGLSITKTLNYTGNNITSMVLSGNTPNNISLTKTLVYTGNNLDTVTYS